MLSSLLYYLYGPLNRLSIHDSNNIQDIYLTNNDQNRIYSLSAQRGWGTSIEIDYLQKHQASLLPGGTLTICLKVIKPGRDRPLFHLSEDLQICMDDPQFSDCEIVTNELKIKCHKFMLGARSCVFKEGSFFYCNF